MARGYVQQNALLSIFHYDLYLNFLLGLKVDTLDTLFVFLL